MAQWTSAVGAAQLTRLLRTQRGTDVNGPLTGTSAPAGNRREVSRTGRTPAYRALADGIRILILEGRLPVATRLPAERELASAMSVSRTTVAAAFEALRGDGFLTSRRGAGSWTVVPDGNPVPTGGLEPLPPEAAETVLDLGCAALPAPEPYLTRAFERALTELAPHSRTHGDYPAGLPALRSAIAERYTERGVPTMPEQIMVATGAMGGVAALSRLFTGRGERVAVDHPSYANILQLLRRNGARLVPVPMGEALDGWDLPSWRQVLRDAAPRMAYVVGDFHNPTGALTTEEQRRELVAAARSAGTLLVADETMAELPLDPELELPRPMAAFDPGGATVLTVGSASKAIWAGLRIGWVRAAPEVIRRLVSARAYADLGSPVLEQLAVAGLMTGGGWRAAIDARQQAVRGNRDALVTALRRELPDWEFSVPSGGLTLWARTGGLSGTRIAEMGERMGVRIPSGPRFGIDGAFEGYVRLPFTLAGPLANEAVARLASAVELVRSGTGSPEETPRSQVA